MKTIAHFQAEVTQMNQAELHQMHDSLAGCVSPAICDTIMRDILELELLTREQAGELA